MKASNAIIFEYNFWVDQCQFELEVMRESGMPTDAITFGSKKVQERTRLRLEGVADFAFSAGEYGLAMTIQHAARELASNAVVPMPI